MKHRMLLMILLLCLCVNIKIKGEVPTYDETRVFHENVVSIEIIPSGPCTDYAQKYAYITYSQNEIIYLLNCITNLNLVDDGQNIDYLDAVEYTVKICLTDGSVQEFSLVGMRLYDAYYKQYGVDKTVYSLFFTLINGFNEKKFILDDKITFEPSEWAKDTVEKATNLGLVPQVNRIDYDKRITRAEVCHLIYNLLQLTNTEIPMSKATPFEDTMDVCIESLYHLGIINGKSEEEFCPHDYITREEFAKILSKVCDVLSIDTQSHDDNLEFSDQNKISAWALDYVNDVRASGIMIGDPENRFNPQSNITKQEVITTLLRVYNSYNIN